MRLSVAIENPLCDRYLPCGVRHRFVARYGVRVSSASIYVPELLAKFHSIHAYHIRLDGRLAVMSEINVFGKFELRDGSRMLFPSNLNLNSGVALRMGIVYNLSHEFFGQKGL